MMAVSTASNQKIPASDADLAKLFNEMAAYTGKYRIEGDDFVTMVDVAWHPVWVGSEQRRHYKLEGDKLTIVSAPQRIGAGPKGVIVTSTLVWEREK
jgi:lipocalin-like protein